MNVTDKGKAWEIRNSLWLIVVFVPFFQWIAFFWIGSRARQKKWIISGWIYMFFSFILPFGSELLTSEQADAIFNIFIYGMMISWIISIIHAILSRKEYLIRREAVLDNRDAEISDYRRRIQNEHTQYRQPAGKPKNHMSPPQAIPQPFDLPQNHIPPPQAPASAPKIDLNTATEQELANLPGVGVITAKKAVEMRTQIGGFSTVQDFNRRLELMPHFAAQIENLAFTSPIMPQAPPPENKGRVVDI